jgi:tetratricopeptide (TPR) repeat protein
MSQKKLKKIRKENNQVLEKVIFKKKPGIREIIKNNWKFLAILLMATVGIYFNSLKGDFVSDDYASITQNSEIKNFGPSFKSIGAMTAITNTILANVFGTASPIPYHVFNLVLYLLVLLVAFVFIFLLTDSKLISKITLIVFTVLPIHVESISWISGRPYLFVAFFVLLMLDLLILFIDSKEKKYLWLILMLLPILFKTDRIRGFAFVILSILYLLTFKEKLEYKIKFGNIFLGIFIFTIFLGVISWPVISDRILNVNSGVNASDSVFYNPFFQYPTAIPKYLQLILFPTDLTLYHTMYVVSDWLNWIVLLVYLTTLVWFYFKDKRYFFALAFVFAASAPSMAPVKVSWLVAERYVFLGSLGIALLFGLIAERYWTKWKYLVIGIMSVLVLVYAVRVYIRNIDWQTNHNLWVSSCQVSPNSHNAWNNIGDDYDKLAQLETTDGGKMTQYENAVKGFGMSFTIKPNYADAYHNQANIFYKIGRYDLARSSYERAIAYNPGLYQTYLTLIQLDVIEKNKTELLRHVDQLNKVKPGDLQSAYITTLAYINIGMMDEAKNLSALMYQQFPNIPEIRSLYLKMVDLEATSSNKIKE